LGSQKSKLAASVPLGWLALGLGLVVWCVLQRIAAPLGPAILALLVLVIAVSQIRLVALVDERLITRAPFRTENFDARSCAFGIDRVDDHEKGGPTYVVFLTDGQRSVNMVRCLTLRGAERNALRIERMLFQGLAESGRAGARAKCAATRASWEAILAARTAYLNQSSRLVGRIALAWIVAVVVIAAAWSLFVRGR